MATEVPRPAAEPEERMARLEAALAQAERERDEAHARERQALEQQAATAEILRVIASSPADLQRVLDTIVASAARLCGASMSALQEAAGESLVQRAVLVPEHMRPGRRYPAPGTRSGPLHQDHAAGAAVLQRRTVHISDTEAPDCDAFPVTRENGRRNGFSAVAVTPLLRRGESFGVMGVNREEPRSFTDN